MKEYLNSNYVPPVESLACCTAIHALIVPLDDTTAPPPRLVQTSLRRRLPWSTAAACRCRTSLQAKWSLPPGGLIALWSYLLQLGDVNDGGTVIGHGIGGIVIPAKMAHLTKARRWSKQWRTCLSSPDLTATQISDGSKIQVRRHHVLRRYHTNFLSRISNAISNK
jgi:hypothetical protein